MALINELSQQIPLPEFDLFAIPPTQTTVREDLVTEHRPLNPIAFNYPLEFLVQSAQDEYINLREMVFYLKFHLNLKKNDRSNITKTDWEQVKITQNVLHSMFETVEASIGDTAVNSSNSNYSYRAYFDALFNTSDNDLKSYMTAGGYLDETKRNKLFTPDAVPADTKTSKSKVVDLGGRLHLDLTFQDRAIVGGTDLKIKLIPHNPKFYLQVPTGYEVEVEFDDAFIEIHRSKIYEPVVEAHEKAMSMTPAKYPINRLEVKTFTLMSGALDGYVDHAISGQLPHRLIVGLVDNQAYHGTMNTDPFNFKHFNLDHIVCYLNGSQYPCKPYKPNFTNGQYIREYLSLFTATNQIFCNSKTGIDRDSYANGKTFFAFNFAPDLADDCNSSGYTSLIKRGTLRLELHFATALQKTVNVILFCEYDNILQINKDRNAITDFY